MGRGCVWVGGEQGTGCPLPKRAPRLPGAGGAACRAPPAPREEGFTALRSESWFVGALITCFPSAAHPLGSICETDVCCPPLSTSRGHIKNRAANRCAPRHASACPSLCPSITPSESDLYTQIIFPYPRFQ